jgi:hypothetical protein
LESIPLDSQAALRLIGECMDHGRDIPVFALFDLVIPPFLIFSGVGSPSRSGAQGSILTLVSIHVANQGLEKGVREVQFMDGYKFVVVEVNPLVHFRVRPA